MNEFREKSLSMIKSSLWLMFIALNAFLIGCATTPVKEEPAIGTKISPLQGKIVVRWQNVKGYNAYGFNILRGESREGPFTRLNQDIILASSQSKPDTDYMFVDQPLEIGKIYYYYVESVNYAGQKKQMTPLSKVVVKTPVDEPEPPPETR